LLGRDANSFARRQFDTERNDRGTHRPDPAHIAPVEQVATNYGKPIQVLPNDNDATDADAKQLALILANKEDVHTGMSLPCQAMMGDIKQAQQ
jgi:hypothetical protein